MIFPSFEANVRVKLRNRAWPASPPHFTVAFSQNYSLHVANVISLSVRATFGSNRELKSNETALPKTLCPSVCPHETTLLCLEGFGLNMIFEFFIEDLSIKFRFQ